MRLLAILALTLELAATIPIARAAVPAAAPPSTLRLIDVGGRKLAVHVTAGRPAGVIFEAGFVIAKDSGHIVMSDRPNLVENAVVAAVRQAPQN